MNQQDKDYGVLEYKIFSQLSSHLWSFGAMAETLRVVNESTKVRTMGRLRQTWIEALKKDMIVVNLKEKMALKDLN